MRPLGCCFATVSMFLAAPVAADQIATAPIYGGGSQTAAVCYVFNLNTAPVQLLEYGIYDETGRLLKNSGKTCSSGVPLAANKGCLFTVLVPPSLAHFCKVRTQESNVAAQLRATFDLRSSNTVLSSTPLK
jgi:hypothetical protein